MYPQVSSTFPGRGRRERRIYGAFGVVPLVYGIENCYQKYHRLTSILPFGCRFPSYRFVRTKAGRHFDRDDPVQPRIAHLINLAHCASAAITRGERHMSDTAKSAESGRGYAWVTRQPEQTQRTYRPYRWMWISVVVPKSAWVPFHSGGPRWIPVVSVNRVSGQCPSGRSRQSTDGVPRTRLGPTLRSD